MLSTSVSNYSRVMPLEDDFVAFRHSPFEDDGDSGRFTAVAVDWNAKQATFNVTLLSSHDGAEDKLWADSFSISKIEKRHLELCLVYPELESHLPKLPKDPQGIWGYIQMAFVPPELCKKMEEYFKDAFDICGWKLFSSSFFGEPLYDDDYTISSLELQRQHFVKEIEQLLQEFQRHLVEKRKASSTDQLFEWYNALWDCLDKVTDAEGKLLAFDCEPYEELRDIAQRERSESATMFNQQSMTTSTFRDNAQTFNQWEDQYIEAVKKINEFRIAHFKISLPRLQQLCQLLRVDSAKFTNGERNRAMAIKLYELQKKSFQNEIEMLNCTNQLKLLERDKIRRDAIALDEDLTMAERLNEKEVQVYEKQCEILATSFEIQDKNEKLVRLDLQNNEETGEEMERLKRNKSLTSISRKKALLRNKKKTCEEEIKKLTRKEKDEQEHYVAHHAVQMKIEKRREENEEKKSTRLEERQKALIRLKEYKKKHPKGKDVKPPRYQAPSVRKQEQKIKNTSSLDTNASSTPPAKAVLRKDKPPKENRCVGNNNASSPPTVCTPPPPPTGAVCPPPPPPPPPPGLPPPPPGLLPSLPSSSAVAIKVQTSKNSPAVQASSLSQKTLDLDALKIARCRLKKQDNSTPTVNNNQKGLPSGDELTRAIQSVKLRKVVSEEKPAELSPDGAEFLKKALERMNKFTNLSFDDDQGDEEEQEW